MPHIAFSIVVLSGAVLVVGAPSAGGLAGFFLIGFGTVALIRESVLEGLRERRTQGLD